MLLIFPCVCTARQLKFALYSVFFFHQYQS